jgi:hypothetical protein
LSLLYESEQFVGANDGESEPLECLIQLGLRLGAFELECLFGLERKRGAELRPLLPKHYPLGEMLMCQFGSAAQEAATYRDGKLESKVIREPLMAAREVRQELVHFGGHTAAQRRLLDEVPLRSMLDQVGFKPLGARSHLGREGSHVRVITVRNLDDACVNSAPRTASAPSEHRSCGDDGNGSDEERRKDRANAGPEGTRVWKGRFPNLHDDTE